MDKEKSQLNVEKIDIKLLTRQKMKELSNGEIKQEGLPEFTKADKYEFRLADDGLFSEKIFGLSTFTKRGKERLKSNYGFDERKQRFGHISTPLYVNPLLCQQQGNVLQKILSFAKTTPFNDIINYKSYMVYVPPTASQDTLIMMNKYFNNEKVKLSFLITPGGLKGKFYSFKFENLSRGSHTNPEMIRDFEELKKDKDVIILTGAYAILFLLLKIDFKIELGITLGVINKIKGRINASNSKPSTKDKDILDVLVSRYNTLKNLIEGGIRPIDLINDMVLVIPAGWRDVSMVKDKTGNIKPNKPAINKRYTEILNLSQSLKKTYPVDIDLDKIFANKNDISWSKKISVFDTNFQSLCRNVQENIKVLFNDDIVNVLAAKEGKIRQKVLSKRLDFTGRSVITPDPQLELDEIGIPMGIILEFYKTRIKKLSSSLEVYNNIINRYISNEVMTKFNIIDYNNSEDNQLVDPIKLGWDTSSSINNEIDLIDELKKIISEHRVINIRFPSLHRYSALGFKMKIVFDNTIHFHPLVCTPYNADFDGDTMSVYLIETREAVNEIDEKMLPSKNLLDSNGNPFILPTQDAILGSYYLTLKPNKIQSYKEDGDKENSNIPVYEDYDDMYKAYATGKVGIHSIVTVKVPNYKNSWYNKNFHDWFMEKKFIGNEIRYEGIYYDSLMNNSEDRVSVGTVLQLPEYKCTPEKYITSTVGRFIMNTVLPQDAGYVNRSEDPYGLEMDKYLDDSGLDALDSKTIKKFVRKIISEKDVSEVKFILDNIKLLGYHYATESGMSMTLQDVYSHPDKTKIINKAQEETDEIDRQLRERSISEDDAKAEKETIWTGANEELTNKLMDGLEADNPVKMMSVSGSRGNTTQIAQLMGMRGLMANTSGEVILTPVTSSFLDGLSMPELFVSTYGARKGIFDRSNRTKETGAFTRSIVYGNSNIIISEGDCGDSSGYLMMPLRNPHDHDKIDKDVGNRVYGKIIAQDLVDEDGTVILKEGQLIERENIEDINRLCTETGIRVRTPMTCKSKRGLCAKCYGKHLGLNRFAKVGDAAGIVASHTIGEPGTQLTMRTFHTGGVAKGDVTKGFENISNIVETTKHEQIIQDTKDEIESKKYSELDNVKEAVKSNILRYKDIEDNLIPSYPFKFEDFGVVCGDEYIEMLVTLKTELQETFLSNGIDISDTHFELIVRSMGETFTILDSGDSIYEVTDKINWNELVTNNIGLILKGKEPIIVTPEIQSLQAKVNSKNSVFLALNYQRLKGGISTAISQRSSDNLLNPMLSVTVGNKFVSPETINRFQNILNDDKNYKSVETKQEMLDRLNVHVRGIDWTSKESVDNLQKQLQKESDIAQGNIIPEEVNANAEVKLVDNRESTPGFGWDTTVSDKVEKKVDMLEEKQQSSDNSNPLKFSWDDDSQLVPEVNDNDNNEVDILAELSKLQSNDNNLNNLFDSDDSIQEDTIDSPFFNDENLENIEDDNNLEKKKDKLEDTEDNNEENPELEDMKKIFWD